MMNKIKPYLFGFSVIALFILATASAWVYSRIDGALPKLDGNVNIYGLNESVSIERDENGIATIKAQNRTDAAIALGFIHSQERFFQMDLLRRNSAGELSSLFGDIALEYDKEIKVHRFRERARTIVRSLAPKELALLKAYTNGVNQGLERLGSSPFEYLLLRQEPVLWREEDTILTVLSMYLDLQYAGGERELSLAAMQKALPAELFSFFSAKGSQWDATLDSTQFKHAVMPEMPTDFLNSLSNKSLNAHHSSTTLGQDQNFVGSNNWAVSGALTATGSAIVANDMHLGIRVPNTWYRATIEYKADNKQTVSITGATLPGTPNVIVGSNGHIAWGFTNSYGDWSDVVVLKTNGDNSQYLTPNGYQAFTNHIQVIAIKDKDSVEIQTQETIWGPVIGKDSEGNLLAYRWVAHDQNAVNLAHVKLETATTVNQAFAIAATAGIPAQNMMVADKHGDIGWTIMGQIPRKVGAIDELPTDWSTGEFGWNGYLSAHEYPKVKTPAEQRLWTANSRVVGGNMYKVIGNGGYALGARAKQIKQRLFEHQNFNEQTLLDIALDTEAIYLARWQQLLTQQVMTKAALANNPNWQEALSFAQQTPFYANADSVTYRLIKTFKSEVKTRVFEQLNNYLSEQDDNFSFHTVRNLFEEPLWQLVTKQPNGFLADNLSWQALLADALNETLNDMTDGQTLSEATWGQTNAAEIKHPLAGAIPIFGKTLNMPADHLGGDSFMPRVDGGSFGASERMIVSPGQEASGIFHMPTSQAGHPWSPYYGKGHSDWVEGRPSPFLPGKTKYKLTLLKY